MKAVGRHSCASPRITFNLSISIGFDAIQKTSLTFTIDKQQPIDFDIPTVIHGIGPLDSRSGLAGLVFFGIHVFALPLCEGRKSQICPENRGQNRRIHMEAVQGER
jgi:hypothetical protein